MTFSVLAPSTLHLAGFRLLLTIGSGAGFAVILLSLRLDPKGQASSQESAPESAEKDAAESLAAELISPPEVIRLSTNSVPTRSSEMTQQQKIAAALSRAGLASPGWSQSEVRATSTAFDSPSKSTTKSDEAGEAVPTFHSGSKRKLIVLGGAILVALGLVLLAALR